MPEKGLLIPSLESEEADGEDDPQDASNGTSQLPTTRLEEQPDQTEEPLNLSVSPRLMDFGMIPVFQPKTGEFSVTNNGNSTAKIDLVALHEVWLRDFSNNLLKFSPQVLIIKPGTTIKVAVTVCPSRVNIQNFIILHAKSNCDASSDDSEDEDFKIFDIREAFLVKVSFSGWHAVLKVIDMIQISQNPVWDAYQCSIMFSLNQINQLLEPYRHSAQDGTVPYVPTVKFRFPAAPLGSDSAVFQLLFSNSSDIDAMWEVRQTPPRNWEKYLNTFLTFDGPNDVPEALFDGSKIKDNPALLSVVWGMKFGHFNAKLPVVPKKAFEPHDCVTAEDLRTNVFEMSPKKGVVSGKGSQLMTITFHYTELGTHRKPFLLRVYPGIFLWLDFVGQTVSDSEPCLQVFPHFNFHQVSCATVDPPLQYCMVYNGGNVPGSFTVDKSPFESLRTKNFNHATIECLMFNGVVQPKSWYPIKLRFSPLEYREYKTVLRILPERSKTIIESFLKGSPSLNTNLDVRPFHSSELYRTILYDRSVPISLHPTHVIFPHLIPNGHKASSCVFLTNLHPQNYMRFTWSDTTIEGNGAVRIEPKCGRIAPRDEVSCMIFLDAGNISTIFTTNIRCTFEDEHELIMYEFVLRQWEKEMAKRRLLDTNNLVSRRDVMTPEPQPTKSFSRLLTLSAGTGTVFGKCDDINKEKGRLPSHKPLAVNFSNYPRNEKGDPIVMLSKFESDLSSLVISNLLRDILLEPGADAFLRQVTRREAPIYEDYKNSATNYWEPHAEDITPQLSLEGTEDLLDYSLFNLIQEMSSNFIDRNYRTAWHHLPPIQPRAMLRIEENLQYNNND